jgi:hypothetical protein
MRCLLDENLPHKLRSGLSEFDPVTVQYAGFSGLKNGELLKAAEASGFDVLVTGDKTLEYEQSMKDRGIAVVALSAPHWEFVKDHVARIADAIRSATTGSFTRVEADVFLAMLVGLCGGRSPALQRTSAVHVPIRLRAGNGPRRAFKKSG